MPTLRERIAAVPFAKPAYRGLVQSVRRSGVPAVWRALTGRRHVILTFHRVRPPGQAADPFDTCPSVSAETFQRILEHLQRRFTILPLAELCERRGQKAPVAAVTFDDGWRDNYDLAFPILRQLGVPATIFLVTSKIGGRELFWQQTLGQVFRAASEAPRGDAANGLRSLLRVRDGRPLTYQLYRDTVVCWKNLKQAECFDRLRRAGWAVSQGAACPRQFLTADEVREMAAAGVSFGSHTVTHAILPYLPAAQIEWELAQSKAALEGLLGGAIGALAYPNGQWSPLVVEYAQRTGYSIACTTHASRLSGKERLLCLPRFDLSWDSMSVSDSFRSGAFEW